MDRKPKFRMENNILIGEESPDRSDCKNIGELVIEKLKQNPTAITQVYAVTGDHNTAEEVYMKSVKCAIWLKRQGIEAGDIVGVAVDNGLEVCIPVLALLYISAINSPWDHDMTKRSARYYVQLMSPKLVFITAEFATNLQEAAKEEKKDIKIVTVGKADGFESLDDVLASVDDSEIDHFKCTPVKSPDDTVTIASSSGTTGLPKGTIVSHRSMLNAVTPSEAANVVDGTVMWMATVRWHLGLTLFVETFLSNARALIIPDIDNDIGFFEYIDKYGVTDFVTDPAVPNRWLKLGYHREYPLMSLKKIIISGASFTAEKQRQLAQNYPHARVLQCFGMTDCGGMSTCQTVSCKPGSSGYICRGQMMKFIDTKTGAVLGPNKVGEIHIKSPFVLKGYYNNPEATKKSFTEDGWFRTNDLAYYDEDGEVFYAGRISEFINYRGINLSPMEIESVLESHSSVMKAVVVSVFHDVDEEHPMAFIVKVPGKEVTAEELMKLVEDNLPWYCKLQAGVQFIEKMPRTATGKIARKQLKDMANQK